MKNKNWPLIIITGFGIFAIFFITFIFVQNLAINTVKKALIIEKAYPKIKPQEYINLLQRASKQNKIQIKILQKSNNAFLIEITRPSLTEKLFTEAPNLALLTIINATVYDLGDGTGIVANNPYIWDMIAPSSYVDDIAQGFSEEISLIFDSIYWDYKKKEQMLKE